MAEATRVIINNANLGGLADSKYQGVQNSLAAIVGFDLHSEPGVMLVSRKLVKESGTNIDQPISKILPCSDGNTYLFGKTDGKIWKRTSNGTYTLVRTNANGGILGAEEYNGYIYYAGATKLGRWQINAAWTDAVDTWATFTAADSADHPMIKKNLILYIGDGYLVAQVEENAGVHTFTGDALDLEKQYHIRSFGETDTEILIGTYVAPNVSKTHIFRWNTWSNSFSSSDPIPEVDISCFLQTDNNVVAYCGQKGNMYGYDGVQLVRYKRVPGAWNAIPSNASVVHPAASANYNGLPLFGLSYLTGLPALFGVYSFGSYSQNYPDVLSLEYIISTGNTGANVEIYAISVCGNDILVAWRDGSTYGVDKVDGSLKQTTSYFDTRMIDLSTHDKKTCNVAVNYRSLPSWTAIAIGISKNGGSFTNQEINTDTARKRVETKTRVSCDSVFQIRVTCTANSSDAPEIESVEITFP